MSNFSLFIQSQVRLILVNNDIIIGTIIHNNDEILEILDSTSNKTRYIIKSAIVEIEKI
ncbi:hypothetical protein [Fusobacterium polymorphum]|uniref:hypothetical protein n=1 Tax=Fusobacterium nucleatum subsp. polymorphum TaxID=76857 RepID=UPI00164E1567|nr:hypothetical protein [Fusobacterium polymorphum]